MADRHIMGWFLRWFRPRKIAQVTPFGGFCDAQLYGRRCVKVMGHGGHPGDLPVTAEHDFGGYGLLDRSDTKNSRVAVPAQALVDALQRSPGALSEGDDG